MSNLLISKENRNILFESEFLKNTAALLDIWKLIQDKKSVAKDQVNDELGKKIETNLSEWRWVSLKEWEIDSSKSPYEATHEEIIKRKYHCAFCNVALSKVIFAINNNSGRVITLGETHSKLLAGDLEFMTNSHLAKDSVQQERLEQLQVWYPTLQTALQQGSRLPEEQDFVLPKRLSDLYLESFKKLKSIVKNYLRNGKKMKAQKIPSIIRDLNDAKEQIEKFITFAKTASISYLYQSEAQNMENTLGKNDTVAIVEAVKNNDGKINTDIATRIPVLSFLSRVEKNYTNNHVFDFLIRIEKLGRFVITFKRKKSNYSFSIASKYVIEESGYPDFKHMSLEDFISKVGTKLKPTKQTTSVLLKQSRNEMFDNKLLDVIDPTSNFNDKKKNWFVSEYSSHNFLSEIATGRIYDIPNEILIRNKMRSVLYNEHTNLDYKAFAIKMYKNSSELLYDLNENYQLSREF